MDYEMMILPLGRVVMGGLTAFLAIYLWSQTRDAAWMLVIMGIVVRYLEITFSTLAFFGVIDATVMLFDKIPLARLLLENLPYIFFSAALILMIRRRQFR